jgi:phospholipid/cholesterol/gamma-HCH transport system ATP-binding protein
MLSTATGSDTEIGLRDLRKSFDGRNVLDGLTLEVRRGEFLAIVGRSGSGKSVLLRLIVGLIQPDSGGIEVGDVDPAKAPREKLDELRDRIGFLFQGAALLNSLTVFDNVALPLRERARMPEPEVRKEVLARLRSVGLEKDGEKLPGQLSGGMRKRAGLARALVGRRDLFLYDEPTAGLDPIAAASIRDLLREIHEGSDATSVLVSHDLDLVFHLAERVAFLEKGKIHAVGTPEELRQSADPVIQRFLRGEPEPERPMEEKSHEQR